MTGDEAVVEFPIEAGHVLAFARSLGEDREHGDGGGLPVTFPIAVAQFDPAWPMRPRPGRPWAGSGGGVGDRRAGGLHAEQEFEYLRPIRIGEQLTVRTREGRTWQREGRRGTLTFSERVTEYRDDDGELVVRATTVAVRSEKAGGS